MFNILIDFWKEGIRELQADDYDDPKIKHELGQAIAHLKKAQKLFNRPEPPETCDGFIGDCDRSPSKYYDLKDSWYCIGCFNEMADHYSS